MLKVFLYKNTKNNLLLQVWHTSNAAERMQKITNFFKPNNKPKLVHVSLVNLEELVFNPFFESIAQLQENLSNLEELEPNLIFESIIQLQEDLLKNVQTFIAFKYNIWQAIYEYLIKVNNSTRKIVSSEAAANMVYIFLKSYTARRIYFLAKFYLQYWSFSIQHHGWHQKHKWLVDDENVALRC